jgi:predicted nucleic acid-binding protein
MENKNELNEVVVNKTEKYYITNYNFEKVLKILEEDSEEIEVIRSTTRLTEDEIVIDPQETSGLNTAISDDYEYELENE